MWSMGKRRCNSKTRKICVKQCSQKIDPEICPTLATSWPGPAVGSSDAGGASAAAVAVAPGSSVEQHKLGARGSSRDCTLHIRSVRGGRSDAERPCHRVGL